jgi:hypothetical protein
MASKAKNGRENKNDPFAALHLVRFWHKADIQVLPANVRFRG